MVVGGGAAVVVVVGRGARVVVVVGRGARVVVVVGRGARGSGGRGSPWSWWRSPRRGGRGLVVVVALVVEVVGLAVPVVEVPRRRAAVVDRW